jgi:hypothetical protein
MRVLPALITTTALAACASSETLVVVDVTGPVAGVPLLRAQASAAARTVSFELGPEAPALELGLPTTFAVVAPAAGPFELTLEARHAVEGVLRGRGLVTAAEGERTRMAIELLPPKTVRADTCELGAFDPCERRSCGRALGPCGIPVSCGTCPETCGLVDGWVGCSCEGGKRLAIDRLATDVQGGPDGWYHCYRPAVPPVAGDPRAPSPCETFHGLQEPGAFYVYPDPGPADSGLVPLYYCSANFRHFLTTDPTCKDLKQGNLVQTGVLGWIATEPICGAVPLRRFHEGALDNDRAYLWKDGDVAFATANPAGYDQGSLYVEEGVIGYVWPTP